MCSFQVEFGTVSFLVLGAVMQNTFSFYPKSPLPPLAFKYSIGSSAILVKLSKSFERYTGKDKNLFDKKLESRLL